MHVTRYCAFYAVVVVFISRFPIHFAPRILRSFFVCESRYKELRSLGRHWNLFEAIFFRGRQTTVHNILFGFRHNKNARPKNSSTWFTVRNSFLCSSSFFYLFFVSIIIMRPIGRSYNNRRQVNTVEMMSNTNTKQWRGNNTRSPRQYLRNEFIRTIPLWFNDKNLNAKQTKYTSRSNQSWAEITVFRVETVAFCLGRCFFSHFCYWLCGVFNIHIWCVSFRVPTGLQLPHSIQCR